MLGFRIFPNNRILKKSNSKRIWKRLRALREKYDDGDMSTEEFIQSLEGWFAYAKFANTYHLRKKVYLNAKEIFLQRTLYSYKVISF
jgi:hypothetical protein